MALIWAFPPEALDHRFVGGRIHYPHGHTSFKLEKFFSELTVDDNDDFVRSGTHLSFSLSRPVIVTSDRACFSCLLDASTRAASSWNHSRWRMTGTTENKLS